MDQGISLNAAKEISAVVVLLFSESLSEEEDESLELELLFDDEESLVELRRDFEESDFLCFILFLGVVVVVVVDNFFSSSLSLLLDELLLEVLELLLLLLLLLRFRLLDKDKDWLLGGVMLLLSVFVMLC